MLVTPSQSREFEPVGQIFRDDGTGERAALAPGNHDIRDKPIAAFYLRFFPDRMIPFPGRHPIYSFEH